MVHPTTGETITNYKYLKKHNPKTLGMWQTACGKYFGGMEQGDNITSQKGTNSVFIMTWKEIDAAKAAGAKWTNPRNVVNF